jgi:drug/metabolite transporter (DMT)-like permease
MVFVLALAAAMGFAGASVLQQQAVSSMSTARGGVAGLLVRVVARPRWLLGVAVDALAYVLQVLALDHGPLAVVQPLLATGLLFALVFNRPEQGHGMRSPDWAAAAVCAAGLAVFVVVGAPMGSAQGPEDPAWVAFSVFTVVTAAALVVISRRQRPAWRAALLAVAAGLAYGLSAALTKQSLVEWHRGLAHLLTTGYLYGLAAAGAAGMVLVQSAFRAGPLAASLPALTLSEPVFAAAGGAILFGEHLRGGAPGWLAIAAAAISAGAVVYLTRSPSAQPRLHAHPTEGAGVPQDDDSANEGRH